MYYVISLIVEPLCFCHVLCSLTWLYLSYFDPICLLLHWNVIDDWHNSWYSVTEKFLLQTLICISLTALGTWKNVKSVEIWFLKNMQRNISWALMLRYVHLNYIIFFQFSLSLEELIFSMHLRWSFKLCHFICLWFPWRTTLNKWTNWYYTHMYVIEF